MSTPHISAEMGDFAKTVLMPGDPLRAKFIADTFLQDVRQVTGVRGMLGFTGTYEGRPISVMGSGMGMPSIGIYSYELFSFYGVENIIRIGSAGSYTEKAKLFDTVLATGAVSESNYARVQSGSRATSTPRMCSTASPRTQSPPTGKSCGTRMAACAWRWKALPCLPTRRCWARTPPAC